MREPFSERRLAFSTSFQYEKTRWSLSRRAFDVLSI